MKKITLLFLILISCLSNSFGQSFKEEINKVYAFKIADLSPKELEVKYKQLDDFWQELNSDTTTYLPLIRVELQSSGHSSYFYFDMCSYLEMQSFSGKDKRIIEKALSNIKWSEIGNWELIELLRRFALNGIDVSELAFRLFEQEKVKLTNPETNEVFNQGKLFAYLLLPLKQELYLEKMSRYFSKVNPESQRSIITLLWLSNTTFGDEQLQLIASKTANADVRSYASRLLNRYAPTKNELMPYLDIPQQELVYLLTSLYYKEIVDWDDQPLNSLIVYSKLMHHFQIKMD